MEAQHTREAHRRPNKTKAHRILTYRRENLGGTSFIYKGRKNAKGHVIVMCLVTWPMSVSEAGGDLALIQNSLLFLCKCQLVYIGTT